MCELPFPFSKKIGDPLTDRNARTGELTPPGRYFLASSYRLFDAERLIIGLEYLTTKIEGHF